MKRGFTLVELLAVIVILAVVIVIAVPQIANVITQTKKNSLASTAKLIASKAEEKEIENGVLGIEETMTCASLVTLDDNYGNCTVTKTNGHWTVTLAGAGKFAGYTCTGTKSGMTCGETANYLYAYYAAGAGGPNDYAHINVVDGVEDYTTLNKEIFVKFNANDITESYVCTMYKSDERNGEPLCISAGAGINRNDPNSEWSNVVSAFGSTHCTENSTYVKCTGYTVYIEWSCMSNVNSAESECVYYYDDYSDNILYRNRIRN